MAVYNVSILASAGEATRNLYEVCRENERFNPRLRGGGDKILLFGLQFCTGFNPRLRGGGDEETPLRISLFSVVSILASAGEATSQS